MGSLINLFWIFISWVSLLEICVSLDLGPGQPQEVCQFENFQAACPDGHVILMTSALYGRMKRGRCITRDYGFIGCSADVLNIAHSRCSGTKRCDIAVPDKDMASRITCAEDLSYYLLANYTCIPVVDVQNSCIEGQRLLLQQSSATLASSVTARYGCGGPTSPWMLDVDQSQTVRFNVTDFSQTALQTTSADNMKTPVHCRVNAIIKSISQGQSYTFCRSSNSSEQLEIRGGEIEIRIIRNDGNQSNFLLKYEVIGCPDINLPFGYFKRQSPNIAVMKCHAAGELTKVTCINHVWTGLVTNCSNLVDTRLGKSGASSSSSDSSLVHVSQEAIVAMIAGIAIIVGVLILAIGIFILRRRFCEDQTNLPTDHYLVPSHKDALYQQTHRPEHDYAYVDEIRPFRQSYTPAAIQLHGVPTNTPGEIRAIQPRQPETIPAIQPRQPDAISAIPSRQPGAIPAIQPRQPGAIPALPNVRRSFHGRHTRTSSGTYTSVARSPETVNETGTALFDDARYS